MSDALDRVLAVLDSGVQSSYEAGFGTDVAPDKCARCLTHERAVDGELCVGCRAFLLEDSETDPRVGDCAECRPPAFESSARAAVLFGDRRLPPLEVGDVVFIGGRRATVVEASETTVTMRGGTWPVEFADPGAEMEAAFERVRAALALSPEELTRVCDQLTAFARQTVMSFAQVADAFIATSMPMFEACQCVVEHVENARSGPSPVRQRELDLLAERRRSHRRTNRLGPRPGR